MCGILIVFGLNPINRARFDAARDTLLHRGPDAQQSAFLEDGRLALGHTRLSIIDLSSRANQPMRSGSLWVTFNGEIYNSPELRQELKLKGCEFSTSSDTEVLLHGYRIWGEDLCERLLGMFAFVIWDDREKRLFLGRDHFGQKPLYYTEINGEFVAASEIKAIKAYARRQFPLRRESIIDSMVQDFVAEPNTWFQGIEALPAGHQMSIRRQCGGTLRMAIKNYWSFEPPLEPEPINRKNALERLTVELDASIRSHLLADVEIGAFLSGGIDSTGIVTLASQVISHPIKTFSIGFGGDDELPLARATATQIGSVHREAVVTENDFRASLDKVLSLFDQPFADTSLVPTERVSALAAEQVKVVLTGDGGDECFGGYDYGRYLGPGLADKRAAVFARHRIRAAFESWWEQFRWIALGHERWARKARERLVNVRRLRKKHSGILAPKLLAELDGYDPSWIYRKHRDLKRDSFRDAQWVGIKVPLPSKMLAKVDRCSMAHSLETRAPFLNPRLVELMLNLPTAVTNPRNSWYKGMLRQWLDGKILNEVLAAPKRGFSVPKIWSQVSRERFRENEEILPLCVSAGLVQPAAWRKMKTAPDLLWRFMQVEHALSIGVITL